MDQTKARLDLVNEINGEIARAEAARARVNKAKSELGTATHELGKVELKLSTLSARLIRILPPPLTAPVIDMQDAPLGDEGTS